MSNKRNLSSQTFHRLTAISEHPERTKHGAMQWLCSCECGNKVVVTANHLITGHTKSCGCLHRERASERGKANKRHGHSVGGRPTAEYLAWINMIVRCTNPNDKRWMDYGGRGIKVCNRWQESFVNFLADVGLKPSKEYSLDRIDVNKDYGPDNCQWATKTEQARNQRSRVRNYQFDMLEQENKMLREKLTHYESVYGPI